MQTTAIPAATLFTMKANNHPVAASPSLTLDTIHTGMQLSRGTHSGNIRGRMPLELEANLP